MVDDHADSLDRRVGSSSAMGCADWIDRYEQLHRLIVGGYRAPWISRYLLPRLDQLYPGALTTITSHGRMLVARFPARESFHLCGEIPGPSWTQEKSTEIPRIRDAPRECAGKRAHS